MPPIISNKNHKPLISIVSPAFNEAKNLPLMVEELTQVMSIFSNKYNWEYIIVNDGSQDKTWPTILKMSRKHKYVKGLCLSRQFGHQIALTAGLAHAKGDVVIYLDSDLQQPPALIPKLIHKWEKGFKIVHTRRLETAGISPFKQIYSKLFYKVINVLSDIPIKDGFADFKLLDRSVLDFLNKMGEHNRFLRGMVPWLGFKSTVVSYTARPRLYGKPWYNLKRNLEFAKTGILSFSIKPLKYIGYLGVIITFSSALVLLTSFVLLLINGSRYLSPTFLLMTFNTFVMGIILSCTGVLALYISYVYQEVIDRPLYIISETTNI